jgi:hypothetical protein
MAVPREVSWFYLEALTETFVIILAHSESCANAELFGPQDHKLIVSSLKVVGRAIGFVVQIEYELHRLEREIRGLQAIQNGTIRHLNTGPHRRYLHRTIISRGVVDGHDKRGECEFTRPCRVLVRLCQTSGIAFLRYAERQRKCSGRQQAESGWGWDGRGVEKRAM